MSRSGKIILGIFSILPFILLIFYLGALFSFVVEMIRTHHDGEAADPVFVLTRFSGVFIFAILMGVLSLGLKIFYVVHVINNKSIDQTERIIWILVFIFMGLIGIPVYWLMRVWPAPSAPNHS